MGAGGIKSPENSDREGCKLAQGDPPKVLLAQIGRVTWKQHRDTCCSWLELLTWLLLTLKALEML